MPQPPRHQIERQLRALSDPLRLRILHLLQSGERCVCDLTTVLEIPQATASRHVSYLRKAGLVSQREHRAWNYYRLVPPAGAFHRKLLECLDAAAATLPELSADAKRARRLSDTGSRCQPRSSSEKRTRR